MDTIVGHHLHSRDGEDIGEIVDVVGVSGADLTPTWLTVKTGWFNQRLVPFDAVEDQGDRLVTEFDAAAVKDAPKVPVHFEPAGDDLDQLCSHYGRSPQTA